MTGAKEPDQIPIDFPRRPNYNLSRFEVGQSNQAAFKAVIAWADWPSPILILVGPEGSGKTHLGRGWAAKNNGFAFTAPAEPSGIEAGSAGAKVVFLDQAQDMPEHDLFTLMNLALNRKIPALLLAARAFPQQWDLALPDLRSRLYNTPAAELGDPEDDILEPIIRKLFEDTGRDIRADVVDYLMKYQGRSIDNMRAVISELDFAARQAKKDLTKAFASRYLAGR